MRLYKEYRWFRDHRMPVRIVICKARRAGLSTGVSALIYDDTTTHSNSKSLIVANEKNPSENVLGMYTRFWRESPEYFEVGGQRIGVRPPMPPEYNNNPPKDRLMFAPPLDSGIYVATARSIDAFLGYGFQNIHATEASRYLDGHDLFRSLYPTLSSLAHSALYIESTPNGQEGRGRWFYEQCMDAQARKDTQFGEMRLVFNLPILRLGGGLGSSESSGLAKTQTIVQTFTSSMTAIVTSVLPSGAMMVAGDQKLTINGVPQALHVTGIIRGEDIDNTDSVLSSLVANIDAKFSGIDTQERNKGILQKIIGFLFG